MASIDEAYLDMTGTERLHGPALKAAHSLHQRMKAETQLNCSVGIGTSRLIAKVSSGQAKPNGVLWIVAGTGSEISGAARCAGDSGRGQSDGETSARAGHPESRRPGAARRSGTRRTLRQVGAGAGGQSARRRCGGMVRFGSRRGYGGQVDQPRAHLQRRHGRRGPAGSHADAAFARWSGGDCARRICMRARIQLKLRYKDFTTITRAHTLAAPTQLDNEIFEQVRAAVSQELEAGYSRCGCWACRHRLSKRRRSKLDLLEGNRQQRWKDALAAADKLRDKFGESSVTLAAGMRGQFRERTHENPAGLPGKAKRNDTPG